MSCSVNLHSHDFEHAVLSKVCGKLPEHLLCCSGSRHPVCMPAIACSPSLHAHTRNGQYCYHETMILIIVLKTDNFEYRSTWNRFAI